VRAVSLIVGLVAWAVIVSLLWWRERGRLRAAQQAERLAGERRDRFLATVAGELEAPLLALRESLPAAAQARVDELRALVAELGQAPERVAPAALDEVDLAELVREIVEAPPFTDRGPPVILRAGAARIEADRARLANGLRVLLWVVRREVDERTPLTVTVTVSEPDDQVLLELDARGSGAAVDALARLPAVGYGLQGPSGRPGTTLALRVAAQVARAHGGRLNAALRGSAGERFVLALPRAGIS
jgi:signal transduction histidine kinase